MTRHLMGRKIVISFALSFRTMVFSRLDVGVCRRVICFVNHINDDALSLRSHRCSAFGAIATATGFVPGHRKAASFAFDVFGITHMVVFGRWRRVIGHCSVVAWGRISRWRMPSCWTSRGGVAGLSRVSLCCGRRRWFYCRSGYVICIGSVRRG